MNLTGSAGGKQGQGVCRRIEPCRPIIPLKDHRLATVVGRAVWPRGAGDDRKALDASIRGVGAVPEPREAEEVAPLAGEAMHDFGALLAGPLKEVGGRNEAAAPLEGLAKRRGRRDGFGAGICTHRLPVLHPALVEEGDQPPARFDDFNTRLGRRWVDGAQDRSAVGRSDVISRGKIGNRAVLEDQGNSDLAEFVRQARDRREIAIAVAHWG